MKGLLYVYVDYTLCKLRCTHGNGSVLYTVKLRKFN
jgi:hypothetical protein